MSWQLCITSRSSQIFKFTLIGALFLSNPTKAAIELISVGENTASFSKGIGSSAEEGVNATIFGGIAGSSKCEGSGSAVCNNCDTDNNAITQACNEKQIYTNLQLTINFKSDTVAGSTAIGDSDGTSIPGMTIIDGESGVAIGGEHTLKVTWGDICSDVLSLNASCEGDGSGTISVGVDGNGDGDLSDSEDDRTSVSIIVQESIADQSVTCTDSSLGTTDGLCGFRVFPGDKKVFLQNPEVPSSFPSGTDGANHIIVRLYCNTVGFSSITHSNKCGDFDIEKEDDGDLVLSPSSITEDANNSDLVNGTEYFFLAATVDEAQNVGFHIKTSDLVQGTHSATPSEVTGLLSEDFQCFIATAAYGSPFEKNVKVLRDFRDRFLKTNFLGRLFVKTYYKLSPPLAQKIQSRPWLKKLTRWLLTPLVSFATLSLKVGHFYFLLFALFLFITISFLFFYQRRNQRRRAKV